MSENGTKSLFSPTVYRAILHHKKLSVEHKALACAILSFRNDVTFECHPSQSTIADLLGKSRKWVSRGIKVLSTAKIIVTLNSRNGTGKFRKLQYWFVEDLARAESCVLGWSDDARKEQCLDDIECVRIKAGDDTWCPRLKGLQEAASRTKIH